MKKSLERIADIIVFNPEKFTDEDGWYSKEFILEYFGLTEKDWKRLRSMLYNPHSEFFV